MRLLRRSVAVELLVACVILAFTAALVNVATGREVTAALSYPAGHLGPTAVRLAQTAVGQYQTVGAVLGDTGEWALTVTVRGSSGAPAASTVSFSFGVH